MKQTTVDCLISHNPYFNRWFSAIIICVTLDGAIFKVTILILIDGFLQLINIFK